MDLGKQRETGDLEILLEGSRRLASTGSTSLFHGERICDGDLVITNHRSS
jgi:hypothetical protein